MNLIGAIVSIVVGGAMAVGTVIGVVSNTVNSPADEEHQGDASNTEVDYGSR